jgi:hypothetical protein
LVIFRQKDQITVLPYIGETVSENSVGGKPLQGKELEKKLTLKEVQERAETGANYFRELL